MLRRIAMVGNRVAATDRGVGDLTTKELSKRTWPDFERLFTQGNGWDFCWCTHGQETDDQRAAVRSAAGGYLTRGVANPLNRRFKCSLLAGGRAHGILVYAADGEPVGWCRYGPRSDFPQLATRDDGLGDLWTVNCFVVDKRHRRRGVATIALKAALRSIERLGGGTVEAYPIHTAGRHRERGMPPTFVHGVGPIKAAWGRVSVQGYSGTVSMFEREGFVAVAPLGERVVMRRVIRLSGASS
jgi:GNAT superfamily N-acetyltransferase